MKLTKAKERYNLLDILRGISVICMIIYHTLWDLVYIFDVNVPLFRTNIAHVFQQYILWSFIIISGFCAGMGKQTFKRGLIVTGLSVVATIVTLIFMPNTPIIFGVLTFLGVAMIITALAKNLLIRINFLAGITISVVLYALTFNINHGKLGLGNILYVELSSVIYANYITSFFGFPYPEFTSADYVPLLPWLFLFLAGFYLYQLFKAKSFTKYLSVKRLPPIEWIGRNALIIYIIHQPIIYLGLYLIFS